MPSPFPGMDPWLEGPAIFPGFHNSYIAYLREAINAVLPPPYFADIANRVTIEGDGPPGVREPDVSVLQPVGANGSHGPVGGGGVATADATETAAVVVHVPADELTEWTIEVRTTGGGDQLVTAVEVLSPSNKTTDRAEYRAKQRELAGRGVNLVEIDFLRAGPHATAVPLKYARWTAGAFDYHVCVYRPSRAKEFEVYPIRLPQRLPTVAVPLRDGVGPVRVEFQAVFDRCYDAALYARRVRYADPPDPPLTPDQATWVAELLRAKGVANA